jgi:AcrR family transcriptional regulator
VTAAANDPSGGSPLRRRLVAAAVEITATSGWGAVTMSRVAGAVGVSRQTVYNEMGSKQALAEAMVLDELARFLAVVDDAFDAHPDDLVGAIRAAVAGVLTLAEDNALLHAVVSASHGADTELLPLLTTEAGSVLAAAKGVIARRLAPWSLPLDARHTEAAVDLLVRAVLSHVMLPSATPDRTADEIAWLVGRVLEADG